MTHELLVAQLKAAQLNARALDANLEVLLQSLAARVTTPPPAQTPPRKESPESPQDLDPDGVCPHPEKMRRSAAVMGKPRRFLCQMCEKTIDPDQSEEAK